MSLVEVKNGAVFCDSSMVAKKFGVKHAYVIRNCDSLLKDLSEIKGDLYSPLILKEDREYRGNSYTAYLMDREFFSLLAMRFKGKDALEWQVKFNSAFYQMEKALTKKAPTLESLNEIVKRLDEDSAIASVCASTLSRFKKKKKDSLELIDLAIKEIQLTIGFEDNK